MTQQPVGSRSRADKNAAARFTETFDVSRETMEALSTYVEVLVHWQRTTNLIAPETLPDIWQRHITDCAQLIRLAPGAKTWADLGSGAGLPGMIVGILLRHVPDTTIYLIESNAKKAAFLRDAKRRTGAPVEILCTRIESPPTQARLAEVEIVTARALAPLSQLFAYVEPVLTPGARALFMKGRGVEAELAQAAKHWQFDHQCHDSVSNADSAVIEVRSLRSLKGRK